MTIATSIASPAQAFSSARRTIENVALAAVLVLFITFPSQLFNHTLDENRDDIRDWWERRFRLLARARKLPVRSRSWLHDTIAAVTVVLVGALFGGLLDPHFGLTRSSALTYCSVVCSMTLGIAVVGVVDREYRKRRGRPTQLHPRALPAGLLVAALCVLVSRVAGFEPGYLYGIVCGVAFSGALSKKEEGHMVALSVVATIALAMLAWAIWVPLNRAAVHPREAWAVVFGDDLSGAVFAAGIVGSTIGCLPLRFLPGGKIAAWHRGAWAGVFALVAFIFLEVMLNPGRGGHKGHAPLVTAITLFLVFGAGSVAFYTHFARKRRRQARVEPAP